MKGLISTILILATATTASAAPCRSCVKKQQVVVKKVVEPVFAQPVYDARVNYLVLPAGLNYAPLQQAQYGQLQRQAQRLAQQFRDLSESMQPQPMAYQPWQPQQQYVQPQQAQPQCGQCHGQGQQAPPLQQQQQAACDKCGCAKPEQPEQLPPPDEGKPAFSMKLGPDVIAKCAKCHNNDKAAGDLNFEQPLTFAQKSDALLKAATGEMPKEGDALTDEELRQLADQLFRMPTADAEQPPADLKE